MATTVNDNDVLLVTFWVTNNEQAGAPSLHCAQLSHAGAGVTLGQVAAAYSSAIATALKGWLSARSSYRGATCTRVFPLPRPAFEIGTTGTGAGTGGTDDLPRQCAGVLSSFTTFAGRSQRGRFYVPFPASTMLATGSGALMTGAALTLLQTITNAIFAPVSVGSGGNTAVMIPVIYHARTNTFDQITGADAPLSQKFSTQRRRGSYGRANNSPI